MDHNDLPPFKSPHLLEGFPENPMKRKAPAHIGSNADPNFRTKWDDRYIELAAHIASWSKDTAQVGCVIVNPQLRRVIAFSFNGFPASIPDDVKTLQDRENKNIKLAQVIHAEENALLNAGRDARGCHAYIVGRPICNHCAILLIQAGIERVIATTPFTIPSDPDNEWVRRGQLALELFDKAGVGFSPIPIETLERLSERYKIDAVPKEKATTPPETPPEDTQPPT